MEQVAVLAPAAEAAVLPAVEQAAQLAEAAEAALEAAVQDLAQAAAAEVQDLAQAAARMVAQKIDILSMESATVNLAEPESCVGAAVLSVPLARAWNRRRSTQ